MTTISPLAAPLDRSQLVECWKETYGSPPPKGISTRLLRLAVDYQRQVKIHGGLGAAVKRKLDGIATEASLSRSKDSVHEAAAKPDNYGEHRSQTVVCPQPGTRLMREWNGTTHVVDILDMGVLYEGKTYRSLSSIARAITGARWSGPRFFGLTGSGS